MVMKYLLPAMKEVILAVVPVSLFLLLFQIVILKSPVRDFHKVVIGLTLTIFGMRLFLSSLNTGLIPLGENVGATLPQKATLWLIIVFSLIIGYVAALAEPSLLVFAKKIEDLTSGAMSKNLIMHSVAAGLSMGFVLGILRIVYRGSFVLFLIPLVILLALLSYLSPEKYALIAWDAAGVASGAVTVPLFLAVGIGTASVIGGTSSAMAGFGLITLSAFGPVLVMLVMGIVAGRG